MEKQLCLLLCALLAINGLRICNTDFTAVKINAGHTTVDHNSACETSDSAEEWLRKGCPMEPDRQEGLREVLSSLTANDPNKVTGRAAKKEAARRAIFDEVAHKVPTFSKSEIVDISKWVYPLLWKSIGYWGAFRDDVDFSAPMCEASKNCHMSDKCARLAEALLIPIYQGVPHLFLKAASLPIKNAWDTMKRVYKQNGLVGDDSSVISTLLDEAFEKKNPGYKKWHKKKYRKKHQRQRLRQLSALELMEVGKAASQVIFSGKAKKQEAVLCWAYSYDLEKLLQELCSSSDYFRIAGCYSRDCKRVCDPTFKYTQESKWWTLFTTAAGIAVNNLV
eukprot:GILJ01001794.1.p1 GENE.GILJ01001794.1~~GILJ01001794.1.p1  ORF type:complete len:335 (+),score=42.63 GILJ01001794.1:40-1044(+)